MALFKKSSVRETAPCLPLYHAARISDILKPAAIKLDLESTDKDEVLEELVELLVRTGGVKDREAALTAARTREAMGSTGIGAGVAVPHGKAASIEMLVAALGVSRKGIEFGAVDGKPATVILLLLAHTDNPGPHVQALAEIAHLIQVPTFNERILKAKTPSAVLDVIRSEE